VPAAAVIRRLQALLGFTGRHRGAESKVPGILNLSRR